ncbi:MAG: ATP-binding protein, partial [Phycisphaerales bacterium]|nr:ATP-binding protein [Phycisphaerales bacterium]
IGNSMAGMTDLQLVSQSWGMTLRTAQIREQQMLLTESLAGANRELGVLQQQLVRANSFAGLGEMAAGAAHEMNNPLTIICGRAQILARELTDFTAKQDATLIAQQGERLSQIITDMMEFAKPQPPKIETLDYAQVIRDAIASATQRATDDDQAGKIVVTTEITPDLPVGRGDARQIRDALAEVVLNAIQATCAAEAGAHDAAKRDILIQLRFDALDSQIIVQIADRGVGMSEEVMRQAFSPFYSAKTAGRNRGLGLAKALRWIENHNGTIRLDSSLGLGTTAVVILPLASAPMHEEKLARRHAREETAMSELRA